MSKHKLAVISDTHSLLREEIIKEIKKCEIILHAGDIASKETMKKLEALGTTYFVRGNGDKGSWAESIPEHLEIDIYGVRIYVIHNRKQIKDDVSEKDIVIYGHSHKYMEEQQNGVCYFNPGSCGPRRFHQEITMAILTIDDEDKSFYFEKIDCSPVLNAESRKLPDKDMARLIGNIINQMNKGYTAEDIAKKNRIDVDLANKILQIYTTHQGIDIQGIMDRLDIWGK